MISPGFIQTELSGPLLTAIKIMAHRLQVTLLRRAGTSQEIAASAHFLTSEASAFVTGHDLGVDGGTTMTDGI